MRKSYVSRIVGLAALYCAVFTFLVILQFSKKGNFTLSIGPMTVRGQYLHVSEKNTEPGEQDLTGGVKVFYGGLEFGLTEDKSKGLVLSDTNGAFLPANPLYMVLSENSTIFGLPGGTTLVFSSLDSARGSELRINVEFAENIAEVAIPIVLRRSSLVREDGQLGISYNGARYMFGRSNRELEDGKLVLSAENTFVSYRSRGNERVFDPANYAIAPAHNSRDYEAALEKWQNQSYAYWNQNASALQDEDEVIAYCNEVLRQGNYRTAVASISRDFLNGSRRSYRSSGFLGGMSAALRSFLAAERERTNLIVRLVNDGSLDFLNEYNVLDFLLVRSSAASANNALELIRNAEREEFTPDHYPGLLELYSDFRRWRFPGENPVEQFLDNVLLFVSENIHHDSEKDTVYVSHSDNTDLKYNLRLGKALLNWAEAVENAEWAAVGRSLVLSALAEDAGSAELYSILKPGDYNPRAAWLSDNGLWAWTVSPSVSSVTREGDVNIAVSFPVNMTHYMMIRGVRPFSRIQIHDTDFRSDSQFERYDSSGWVYYSQDQVLVLKLRHRAAVENIRIVYRVERPPEPRVESAVEANTGGEN